VSYQDKYGPLGKIAVVTGRPEGRILFIDGWVQSCRAFSRRIEHRCLEILFERFGAHEADFAFQPTPRNGPLRDFFAGLLGGADPGNGLRISRAAFVEACPQLYHRIKEPTNG
jgi:predicted enzyme involved in methoxymalonyl-ACP biosynthesis